MAWSALQLRRGRSRAPLGLRDLSSGPGHPALGGATSGLGWAAGGQAGREGEWRPLLGSQSSRSHGVVLFALGWLASSETQQRPGSQRPCFRQVRPSVVLEGLPPTRRRLRGQREGRPPALHLTLPFTLVFYAKGNFQSEAVTCVQVSPRLSNKCSCSAWDCVILPGPPVVKLYPCVLVNKGSSESSGVCSHLCSF